MAKVQKKNTGHEIIFSIHYPYTIHTLSILKLYLNYAVNSVTGDSHNTIPFYNNS
jgi:hypothetical protein